MKRRASAALAATGVLAVLVGAGCQAEVGSEGSASVGTREQAIVGGAVTAPADYPWMAAISTYVVPEMGDPYWDFDCGGSLIAKGWVMTAAHCVSDIVDEEVVLRDPAFMEVVLGQYDLTNDTTTPDGTEQHVAIDEIIVHPGYQYVEETHPDPFVGTRSVTPYNDIALIRLASDVTIDDSVRIVKLSSGGGDVPSTAAALSGWGEDVEATTPIGSQAVPILKELSSTIVDPLNASDPGGGCYAHMLSEALGFSPQRPPSAATEICMLNYDSAPPTYQSACYKDSGSPWVRYAGACAEQFGIHTSGDYYCVSYDVGTRVSAFLPWIREQGVDYVGDKIYEAEAPDITRVSGGSHPGGWNIYDGSSAIAFNHVFHGGTQQMVVRAEGAQVNGQYPRMRVTVGGTNVYEANLTNAAWTNYPITINSAPVGSREVRITFLNDYYQGGQDRNLFIDKVTISDARTTCDAVGEDSINATIAVVNTWNNGYCANITVTNNGSSPTVDWTVVYDTKTTSIYDSWNPDVSNGTGVHTASPSTSSTEQWFREIPAGQSRVHGFCATRAPGSTTVPEILSFEGQF